MPAGPAKGVDCLVRRDGEEPRLDGSAGFVLLRLHVNLEKGVLEDVGGELPVAEIAAEIAEESSPS